jgi:glycosyltransferase involved in cell wall biosynthesis
MRIAFDYQAFVWQTYGGISRYFTRLAQGLLDLEQQVEIFAPLHRNSYLSSLPSGIVNGRYINQYPPKTARLFFAYNNLGSRYKIACWKPDVVHETYYSRVGTAPRHCQAVITVYDMIHELFPNEFSRRDNTTEVKRRAIERADHVICISENTKQDLMRLHGTVESKISVVHLGFDQFIEQENSLMFDFQGEKPFLLYVGQRSGYKNFSGLLQAVALSKRLRFDFDIVAFGGGIFSSSENSLISSLGFAENQVRQVGGDDALLANYYKSAMAFVYPSLYEGFGIPPLEAMAHQCPVISSNTSSMPEVIGMAAEFFIPSEFDDMRYAIENVVYNDDRIKDLRKAGVDRLARFSWNQCAKDTLNVYRKLTEATDE